MLDESHVDVAGEQGELDRAKLVESPALAAAARRDGFAPHGRDPFAQRLVLDPLQAGKELRDLRDAVAGRLSCCHDGYIYFSRYFWGFEEVRSIIFLASKSSLTVSPYQLIFPENLLFKLLLSCLNNSVWVSSLLCKADRIAFLSVSYFCLLIFFPLLPDGCLVSIFSSAIPFSFFKYLLF